MRTIALANNRLGSEICAYLHDRGDLVGLVVHPRDRRNRMDDATSLGVPTFVWPDGITSVQQLEPDCLLSVMFGYRVPDEWLSAARWRALNLHPGLLPYNAGACPNVWPLVDGSPAGTTLHVMEAEIDSGPVLAQRRVPTYFDDTAQTLYERLHVTSLDLFMEAWPRIRHLTPIPQAPLGSHHRLSDLTSLDPKPEDFGLIDRLRARTFPPFGAEFVRDGQRFRITVEIEALGPRENE